jgi:hypothetical protein
MAHRYFKDIPVVEIGDVQRALNAEIIWRKEDLARAQELEKQELARSLVRESKERRVRRLAPTLIEAERMLDELKKNGVVDAEVWKKKIEEFGEEPAPFSGETKDVPRSAGELMSEFMKAWWRAKGGNVATSAWWGDPQFKEDFGIFMSALYASRPDLAERVCGMILRNVRHG